MELTGPTSVTRLVPLPETIRLPGTEPPIVSLPLLTCRTTEMFASRESTSTTRIARGPVNTRGTSSRVVSPVGKVICGGSFTPLIVNVSVARLVCSSGGTVPGGPGSWMVTVKTSVPSKFGAP